ncbi:hypothetical protein [Microbulbifer variabilis]|uniref:hypothetical protein n=1 Tax=Microbulbifer variabilis TaxID=266805 RepID=UPI001CFEEF17|nr:hypothetical protein [Microbulbifer variabilis]
MWYKRYGYKHPSGSGGIGCIGASLSVIVGFSLAFLISILLKNILFLWLGVPFTFIGFWVAEKSFADEGEKIRKRRFEYHIGKAKRYLQEGKKHKAEDSIKKAKIYGELPDEFKERKSSKKNST